LEFRVSNKREEENENMKILDTYNAAIGAVITVLSALLGIYWYIFVAFLFLNILDWATGWYKARQLQQESSAAGLKGIIKKTGYWVIIMVAFIAAGVFQELGHNLLGIDLTFLNLIGYFTLACLVVNEMRSIIENLVELGYNVPAVLVKGLAIAEKMINKETEEDDYE